MIKIIKHTDGKAYEVNTTPDGRYSTATVRELAPRKAGGVIANFLREYSGKEQYTYDRLILDDDDLIRVVLELGYKFSRSRQWRWLYYWAGFEKKRDEATEPRRGGMK